MSWWRRNTPAFLALVILIPATAASYLAKEWYEYNGERPSHAIDVAAGKTIEYGKRSWGPAVAEWEPEDVPYEAPANARLLRVRIPVSGAIGLCSTPTLHDADGRDYLEASVILKTPYPRDFSTSCPGDQTEFTLQTYYVVPDDVSGPFDVRVYVTDELPRFLRAAIVP